MQASSIDQSTLTRLTKVAIGNCEVGLIVLDHDAHIVLWNDWMVKHARISEESACGQMLDQIFPELTTQPRFYQAIAMALNEGMSAVLSQSLHKAPFSLYSSNYSGTPERIQQTIIINPLNIPGTKRHCLIQINDVTQAVKRENLLRTQARQLQAIANEYLAHQQYLQAILNNAPDAIIVSDEHGQIQTVNPAGEKLFGYSMDELVGKSITLLAPVSYVVIPVKSSERYTLPENITKISQEIQGKHKDGSIISLHLSVSEMRSHNKRLFISMVYHLEGLE